MHMRKAGKLAAVGMLERLSNLSMSNKLQSYNLDKNHTDRILESSREYIRVDVRKIKSM